MAVDAVDGSGCCDHVAPDQPRECVVPAGVPAMQPGMQPGMPPAKRPRTEGLGRRRFRLARGRILHQPVQASEMLKSGPGSLGRRCV